MPGNPKGRVMGGVVLINGEASTPESAGVSVFDRGFLYGDSVFETVGTYHGRPFALVEHIRRLRRSCDLVHIPLELDDEALGREIEHALALAGLQESYVRIIVTRGCSELHLDPAGADTPNRIVIVMPLHRPPDSDYEQGISAITYRLRRAADSTEAGGAKVGNYLVAVLAMRKAREASAKEALVVDGTGALIEGATSNVFLVKGGRLTTPPESSGILAGITRATVMQVAEVEGLPVDTVATSIEDAYQADEVFITSSIRELLAVVRLDGRTVGSGVPGPFYRRLLTAFRRSVEAASAASQPWST